MYAFKPFYHILAFVSLAVFANGVSSDFDHEENNIKGGNKNLSYRDVFDDNFVSCKAVLYRAPATRHRILNICFNVYVRAEISAKRKRRVKKEEVMSNEESYKSSQQRHPPSNRRKRPPSNPQRHLRSNRPKHLQSSRLKHLRSNLSGPALWP